MFDETQMRVKFGYLAVANFSPDSYTDWFF